MAKRKIYLKGQKFGTLTILGEKGYRYEKSGAKKTIQKVKCNCGIVYYILQDDLNKGVSTCKRCIMQKRVDEKTTHGKTHTRFYKTRKDMRSRCNCKKSTAYKNYGGRGIKCLWQEYNDFEKDMYNSYLEICNIIGEKNTSLERVDVNGNYCKENCIWIHRKEQQKNTRRNIYVTHNGKTMILSEWSKYLGINDDNLRGRYARYKQGKISIERVLTTKKLINQFS